jgi:hypothetical protein
MDFLYALTLMVAIAAGVVAILASVFGLAKPKLQMEPNTSIWKVLLSHCLTKGALALGFFSLATSVVVHSRWGHGPGTVAPMDLRRLLSDHEAFAALAAILLLALVLAINRSRRQRYGSAT